MFDFCIGNIIIRVGFSSCHAKVMMIVMIINEDGRWGGCFCWPVGGVHVCGIELPSIVGGEDVNVVYCIVRGLIMMIS